MNVRPIRSEPDYEEALAEIERLFDAVPGTPEGDRLDVLITLVEAYEAEHYPILMEEMSLNPANTGDRPAVEEQLAALDETAGAWTDENHPDLKTDEEIDRWLANLWVMSER